MLILRNRQEGKIINCLKLSFGACSYDDIREFVAERKNVKKEQVLITLIYKSNIVKIDENQINDILPISMLKASIVIEIKPSDIDNQIIKLLNKLDYLNE